MVNIRIISASAGSGKTTRLAAELEAAVTSGNVAPNRIVATTFTRKAAAELVERGRRALLDAGRHEEADKFRAARIGTVNAVAGRLVSEFALDAGISPDVHVLDDRRTTELFQICLGEVITTAELDAFTELRRRFTVFEWQETIRQVVDEARSNRIGPADLATHRDQSWASFEKALHLPVATDLDQQLHRALRSTLAQYEALKTEGLKETAGAIGAKDACSRAIRQLERGRVLSWGQWRALGEMSWTKKWAHLATELESVTARLLEHSSFHADCRQAIELVFDVAARAYSSFQAFKANRRAMDFVDQETIALELLQSPRVRSVLRDEIDRVFVDEFQDTSPLELALFLELADLAEESVWVGDQKQAIYAFRGADPALMDAVIDALSTTDDPETLNIGYRSRPELTVATGALFAPAFAAVGIPEERVHLKPATAEDVPGLGPVFERWHLAKASRNDARAAHLAELVESFAGDAEVNVRDGKGAVRRPRFEDIAVLCRTRAHCQHVADALAARGLPVSIAQAGLLSTLEGRAAIAGLRAFASPDDRVAKAELLRIFELPLDGSELLSRALAGTELRSPQLEAIEAARAAAPFVSGVQALDLIFTALDLDTWCHRWGRSGQRTANLDALRGMAVGYEQLTVETSGSASPAALLAFLLSLANEQEDAQARPADDAITVTTWHAAKGLEWPVVILYNLDRASDGRVFGVSARPPAGPVVLEDPLRDRSLRYWPLPFAPATRSSPLHTSIAALPDSQAADDLAQREDLRLLYVGWTRARDRLILAKDGVLSDGILGRLASAPDGRALEEPVVSPLAPQAAAVRPGSARWGGRELEVLLRSNTNSPPQGHALGAHAVSVFEASRSDRDYPPRTLAPSSVQAEGRVLEVAALGEPLLDDAGANDPAALGSALHAFLAAEHQESDEDDKAEMAATLLDAWGQRSVDPQLLLAAAARLSRWLEDKRVTANGSTDSGSTDSGSTDSGSTDSGSTDSGSTDSGSTDNVRREVPVYHRLESGTIVTGFIDLLVDEAENVLVVDHKTIAGDASIATEKAKAYWGQLKTYSDAVSQARNGCRVEAWVHLPLQGLMVRLGPTA